MILALLIILPLSKVHAQLFTKAFFETKDSSKAMYYVRYVNQEKGALEKFYYLNDSLYSISSIKSVKNKIKTGKQLVYYKNGKIKEDCNYDDNKLEGKYLNYYESGKIHEERNYVHHKLDGKCLKYYENGKIENEIDYSRGEYNGFIKSYYENGNKRRVDKYQKGKLVDGKCFGSNGQDTAYFVFSQMAKFQNGDLSAFRNYVMSKLEYPDIAANLGASGKVWVTFHVDTTGKVVDVEVVNTANYYLSKTAVDIVLNSPDWEPAIYEGKKIKQQFIMPFNFVLNCGNYCDDKSGPAPISSSARGLH